MEEILEEYGDFILGAASALFILGFIVAFFLDGTMAEYIEIFTTWIYG